MPILLSNASNSGGLKIFRHQGFTECRLCTLHTLPPSTLTCSSTLRSGWVQAREVMTIPLTCIFYPHAREPVQEDV